MNRTAEKKAYSYQAELRKGAIKGAIALVIIVPLILYLFSLDDHKSAPPAAYKSKSFSAGDLSYKVSDYDEVAGKGSHTIILIVSISNIGKEPIEIGRSLFKLIDDDGRSYEPSNEWSKKVLLQQSLNPGLTVTADVSFKVSSSASGFELWADSGILRDGGEPSTIEL